MVKKQETLGQLGRDVSIVVGVVLVWRGIWYVLDGIDKFIFGGNHIVLALAGIAIGLLILYLPDRDLKEFKEL